jgi:RNA recognition motif-containing protein
VTEKELQREFAAYGEVVSVTIMNDDYIGSGQSRTYGFVEMATWSEAQTAITALNGKIMAHRRIDVIRALPLSYNRDNGTCDDKRGARYRKRARQRG